jgi:hypothetical protein
MYLTRRTSRPPPGAVPSPPVPPPRPPQRGGGRSRAIKFLYAPAPPQPAVWARKPPCGLFYIKPPMQL